MRKSMHFMVGIRVVLGVVVGPVLCSRIPVVTELVLGSAAPEPPNLHIHHFALAGNNCVVGHPSSCGVISLDRTFWGIISCAVMKSAASSASDADAMTNFIIWAMERIAPLKGGYGSFSERKM